METTNLISTPNITGNVGSCETKVTEVVSNRYGFWKQEMTEIATNSCTGEVTKYDHWEFTDIGSVGLVFVPLLVLLILGTICLSLLDNI